MQKKRAINDTFQCGDAKLKVEKRSGCECCYFHTWCNMETLSLIEEIAGTCFREKRTDDTDIIFKYIES